MDLSKNISQYLTVTHHAEVRSKQRGIRPKDVDLILAHGTECEDGVLLTDADVLRAVEQRKREIQHLERLRGAAVVHSGGKVLTVYRARRGRARHMLRSADRRNRRA